MSAVFDVGYIDHFIELVIEILDGFEIIIFENIAFELLQTHMEITKGPNVDKANYGSCWMFDGLFRVITYSDSQCISSYGNLDCVQ